MPLSAAVERDRVRVWIYSERSVSSGMAIRGWWWWLNMRSFFSRAPSIYILFTLNAGRPGPSRGGLRWPHSAREGSSAGKGIVGDHSPSAGARTWCGSAHEWALLPSTKEARGGSEGRIVIQRRAWGCLCHRSFRGNGGNVLGQRSGLEERTLGRLGAVPGAPRCGPSENGWKILQYSCTKGKRSAEERASAPLERTRPQGRAMAGEMLCAPVDPFVNAVILLDVFVPTMVADGSPRERS
jgi:hypothetical protein